MTARRPSRYHNAGKKPRGGVADISPDQMVDQLSEASIRIFTAAFQTISEGYRQALLAARAAMPEGANDAEKDAVARAVITTFGNLMRNLWVLCDDEAVAGDETGAGRLIRLTMAYSILKANGVKTEMSDEELDFRCDTLTKN